jgi:hypothetical protein
MYGTGNTTTAETPAAAPEATTMSETDNTTTAETPAAAPEAHPAPETFSKEYVQELRNEAAKYRTQKNEAIEATKAALSQQFQGQLAEKDVYITELKNELSATQLELEKIRTALEAKVPSDKVLAFASILQGSDPDAIKASAASATELFGGLISTSPAYDPTQGSGNSGHMPLNGDPLLNALKRIVDA